MRELELAIPASIDPGPVRAARAPIRLSREAFIASIVVHALAGYALSRHFIEGTLPPTPTAEFFLFEMPAPRPTEVAPVAPPVEPVPQVREQPAPEPTVVVEPPAVVEPVPSTGPAPAPETQPARTLEEELAPLPRSPNDIDFDEERRRAANQIITARSAKSEYLTFSVDDVAPPRPAAEPEKRSIFDGTGATRGPTAGQLGQARTKVGQKMSALCNALTGGFSLMGWGSFCAGPSDGGLSGLYPEVRPEYLDLMPECVDTRDTAPELALEAPFPTVKCRLVMPDEIGRVP